MQHSLIPRMARGRICLTRGFYEGEVNVPQTRDFHSMPTAIILAASMMQRGPQAAPGEASVGYGIYLTGRLRKRDSLTSGADAGARIEAIRDAIEAEITDPLQRRLTALDVSDDKLTLRLHPSAEDVEISVEDGEVDIAAKTSSAGPGYHVMLADLLENVASRAGIELSWSDLQVGWADETGLYAHQDLVVLREETIRLLKTLCQHIAGEGDDVRNILVNLPVDDRPFSDTAVLAPMGEFPHDWLRAMCDASDSDAVAMAEHFFAAWHGPDRAEYWASIGRYLILWDLNWTVPINETERSLYEAMLACYDRARELDPSIAIPDDEISEAHGLLAGGDPSAPPRAEGAGYRRGMLERSLNYGWSAEIPGYFRREREIDGDKVNNYFWFGDREIHFTILGFDSAEGGTTATDFVRRNTEAKEGETPFPFSLRQDWLTAQAVDRKPNDHCTVQAMFGTTWKGEQRVLVLTIVHEDTSEGRGWAKALLESVSHPKPEAD